MPVLKEQPFARALDLTLAERVSRYDTFGSTANGKFNLRWKPIDDLLVRASYAQGFHAPSVGQLFQGQTDTPSAVTDPCAAALNPTGVVAANCAIDGVPAGFNPPDGPEHARDHGRNRRRAAARDVDDQGIGYGLQPKRSAGTRCVPGLVRPCVASHDWRLWERYGSVLHLHHRLVLPAPRTSPTPFSGPFCNYLQRD